MKKVTACVLAIVMLVSTLMVSVSAEGINGWQNENGQWKYYQDNVAVTGWKNDITGWEGQWFFFDCTAGVMKVGWHMLPWSGGTDWFCFNTSNGVMYVNCTTPDGYYVDGNGIWSNPEPDPQTPIDLDAFAQRVFELSNEERVKRGLQPFGQNDVLTQASKLRAEELKVSFSHTRPNGTSIDTLIDEFNLKPQFPYIHELGLTGNILMQWTEELPTPEEVVQSFMDSTGHRWNILIDEPRGSSLGVAVSLAANEYGTSTIYVEQLITYDMDSSL